MDSNADTHGSAEADTHHDTHADTNADSDADSDAGSDVDPGVGFIRGDEVAPGFACGNGRGACTRASHRRSHSHGAGPGIHSVVAARRADPRRAAAR